MTQNGFWTLIVVAAIYKVGRWVLLGAVILMGLYFTVSTLFFNGKDKYLEIRSDYELTPTRLEIKQEGSSKDTTFIYKVKTNE